MSYTHNLAIIDALQNVIRGRRHSPPPWIEPPMLECWCKLTGPILLDVHPHAVLAAHLHNAPRALSYISET